jgi:hypothetical protein
MVNEVFIVYVKQLDNATLNLYTRFRLTFPMAGYSAWRRTISRSVGIVVSGIYTDGRIIPGRAQTQEFWEGLRRRRKR